MSLTRAQRDAVRARGNVLVMAGAGTGKTRTLVERCLQGLVSERPRASLDEILVVTFTEAAAAEMRHRLRARLELELAADPADSHWQEQIALFETAHIGTLHSFCYRLVRQHFYELGLDPQVSVLPEEESRLLAEETMQAVLEGYYEGKGGEATAVQELIQRQGKGSDQAIRNLVLKVHDYTQTLPWPENWFREQSAMFASPEPGIWRRWFLEAVEEWAKRAAPVFRSQAEGNVVAAGCDAALREFGARAAAAQPGVLTAVNRAVAECPPRQKKALLEPLQPLLEEAEFLGALAGTGAPGAGDPLAEDWSWVRGAMSRLLGLTREFEVAFTQAKRELGGVDFHDLEQHALRLLWDAPRNEATAVAREWQRQLRLVLVDEYQDINAAQDRILRCLSRQGTDPNLFLVGDVKQSIYRFRLANPKIFQGYAASWGRGERRAESGTGGQVVPLAENFRSREGILRLVNGVFDPVMKRALGGVEYDQTAQLVFGAPEARRALSESAQGAPCVELHLRFKATKTGEDHGGENEDSAGEIAELEEEAKEARLVGLRLRELRSRGQTVWDEALGRFREVEWSDMAVLLRAPVGKCESFAREFSRLEIPLQVERGGFYHSPEVTDLLSLLSVLDNPLQDLPVLAVARSPFMGLTPEELATVRLALVKGHFWTALLRWNELNGEPHSGAAGEQSAAGDGKLGRKVSAFLERFYRWRRLARTASLSRCLESILAETHYTNWLRFQPRGRQRCENVQRLLRLAQHFDKLQRQGLFRFLRFIEAQQRAGTEPDVSAAASENAVRLLSIHQSKGLEFPVVAAADLAKRFNTQDLRAEIIMDEEFGLCPQVMPPKLRKRYPSLVHWLASRRQKRELLGEEMRLLYVAMTRARDLLLLTCSLTQKSYEATWLAQPPGPEEARNCADWLAVAFQGVAPEPAEWGRAGTVTLPHPQGASRVLWVFHDDSSLVEPGSGETGGGTERAVVGQEKRALRASDADREAMRRRLAWEYPHGPATLQPAKTTVSALRRVASDPDFQAAAAGFAASELDRSSVRSGGLGRVRPGSVARSRKGDSQFGMDVGTAHHIFLQHVAIEKTGTVDRLREEAGRLAEARLLSDEQAKLLDFQALAVFWNSELGRSIVARAEDVRRELPFTFRLSPEELAAFVGKEQAETEGAEGNRVTELRKGACVREQGSGTPEGDFVVVQGVADLAVILPNEIWLVDFKTDKVSRKGPLPADRYGPQLKLYSRALSGIYSRPVTQCWLWFLGAGRGAQVGL